MKTIMYFKILCVACLCTFLFTKSNGQATPPILQWSFASPSSLQSYPATTLSDDWIYSITQITNPLSTNLGGFIAAGFTEVGNNTTATIPVIMELDPYGNLIWEKTYAPSIFTTYTIEFTGSQPTPYNPPSAMGELVSFFVDVHEVYDNALGKYVYVAVGNYADGNTNGFPPPTTNTLVTVSGNNPQNNYTYAVEINEDGSTIPDVNNTCFPLSVVPNPIREFWGYTLVGNSSTFPSAILFPPGCYSSGYSLSPANTIGQAVDNLVDNPGYKTIKPVYSDASLDINGYIIGAQSYLNQYSDPTNTALLREAMMVKLDSHLNLDNSFGELNGSVNTGYQLFTDNPTATYPDQSIFRGATITSNFTSSPSFVGSGFVV